MKSAKLKITGQPRGKVGINIQPGPLPKSVEEMRVTILAILATAAGDSVKQAAIQAVAGAFAAMPITITSSTIALS